MRYSIKYVEALETERDIYKGKVADMEVYVCELEARVERLRAVVEAAKIFLAQHDNGDDATSELELLDEALAALGESDE